MPLVLFLLAIIIICCLFFWKIVMFWLATGLIALVIIAAKDKRGFFNSLLLEGFWDSLKIVCLGPISFFTAIFADLN